MQLDKSMAHLSYKTAFDFFVGLSMLAAAGVLIWTSVARDGGWPSRPNRPDPPMPDYPISLEGAVVKGNSAAAVALLVYSDFECPACAKFSNETLPQLVDKYVETGKVLFGFKHFPIEQIHPAATRAAVLASCSSRHGRFWEAHDALFALGSPIGQERLARVESTLGLNRQNLDACLTGGVNEEIARDVAEARAFGFNGTPGFLFGSVESDGRVRGKARRTGAAPVEAFSQILDGLLAGR